MPTKFFSMFYAMFEPNLLIFKKLYDKLVVKKDQ